MHYYLNDQVGLARVTMYGETGSATPPYVAEYINSHPFGGTVEQVGSYQSDFKFTGKEYDDHSSFKFHYFGARYYDDRTGQFVGVDPMESLPSTYSTFAYAANDPFMKYDPNGMNWFFYTTGEDDPSWNWHEGSEYTYTDDDGKEQNITSDYEFFVQYEITGTNDEGASTGNITVYNQNEVVLTQGGVFTGGAPGGWGPDGWVPASPPAAEGTYFFKLWNRDADGPERINPNSPQNNPMQLWGIQKIPNRGVGGYDVGGAYGGGRIRMQDGPEKGNYLHGKYDSHNYTHGCVCDKSERVFNYFWESPYRKNVPFNISRR